MKMIKIIFWVLLITPLISNPSLADDGLGKAYFSKALSDQYKKFAKERGLSPLADSTKSTFSYENPNVYIYKINTTAIALAVRNDKFPIIKKAFSQYLVERLSLMQGDKFALLRSIYIAEFLSTEANFRAYDNALKNTSLSKGESHLRKKRGNGN